MGTLRREIGRLAVELQAARSLVNAAVSAMTTGAGGRAEAADGEGDGHRAGREPQCHGDRAARPGLRSTRTECLVRVGEGSFEDGLRASIMGVVAGGTGDIQRNLIARGMGLPR